MEVAPISQFNAGMDETTFQQRFLASLAETGISIAELSRRTGVTYDVLNKLKRGSVRSTSAENAEKIASFFQWDTFQAQSMTPSAAISRVENGDMAPAHSDLVPVYDISASAGHGAVVDYEGVAYSLAFPPDYIRRVTRAKPADLTIISVKGDSMEPTLRDDDIVMLDMSKTSLGYEGLFVIRVYDVLHVKRLSHSGPGRVMVISDNRENYPPREYPMDEVEVVGKVIWKGGKV